jgi:hypothetical protein
VEVFKPVDLHSVAKNLPLDHGGIPIAYLSLNDFLNLAVLLRSIPELTDYLSARRSLPPADLRQIGDERALFSYYLLSDGSFAGCDGISDARVAVAAQDDRLRDALERKFETDRYAHLMEHVADELATHALTTPRAFLSRYSQRTIRPPKGRIIWRSSPRWQIFACVSARSLAVHSTVQSNILPKRIAGSLLVRAARFDSMPDWVYVVGAAKNVDQAELLSRTMVLMGGAMAFYEKSKCLVIVDRDNSGYEVALSRPRVRPTPEHVEAGKRLFGDLRITTTPLHFLPGR